MVLIQRSTAQIFHQLVVTMLSLNICLAKVVELHNHLEVKPPDGLQELLVDIETGIVDFQHKLGARLILHQKYLGLA